MNITVVLCYVDKFFVTWIRQLFQRQGSTGMVQWSPWLPWSSGLSEWHGPGVHLDCTVGDVCLTAMNQGSDWLKWIRGLLDCHESGLFECHELGVSLTVMNQGSLWLPWIRGHLDCHGAGVSLTAMGTVISLFAMEQGFPVSCMEEGSPWLYYMRDLLDCHESRVSVTAMEQRSPWLTWSRVSVIAMQQESSLHFTKDRRRLIFNAFLGLDLFSAEWVHSLIHASGKYVHAAQLYID